MFIYNLSKLKNQFQVIQFIFRISGNVVNNVDEVYSVGSLGRINEMREFGNKLHMLIQCFRRIKLTKPLFEDQDIDKSIVYNPTYVYCIFITFLIYSYRGFKQAK